MKYIAMKVFYAPYGFKPKTLWPMLASLPFVAVIYIMLFGKNVLDENDRPFSPVYTAVVVIISALICLLFIAYFFSLFKKRVVLRIENDKISCFETAANLHRNLPLSSLVGFTHFYEHSLAKRVNGSKFDSPYRYIVLHFKEPDCAWMIPERSFDDLEALKDFLRSAGIPEIPFARSMYPNDMLYVPVNFLYTPDEEDCGMIVNRR